MGRALGLATNQASRPLPCHRLPSSRCHLNLTLASRRINDPFAIGSPKRSSVCVLHRRSDASWFCELGPRSRCLDSRQFQRSKPLAFHREIFWDNDNHWVRLQAVLPFPSGPPIRECVIRRGCSSLFPVYKPAFPSRRRHIASTPSTMGTGPPATSSLSRSNGTAKRLLLFANRINYVSGREISGANTCE